jgi:hypothetical protein
MTPRERMMRTLDFETPDRVPRQIWALPALRLENDAVDVDAFYRRWPVDMTGPPVGSPKLASLRSGDPYVVGKCHDEWGCEFVNIHAGVHGEVKEPLIANWSDLDKLRPPVEALEFDKDAVNAFCRSSDMFVTGNVCPRPFERLQFLRGSENLYGDLGEEPDELFQLLDIVHRFYVDELESWAQTDVDCLNFMDDWGAQHKLLISPKQWRRIFKPLYSEYVEIAHSHGKKILMHSDGHIESIYDDLIEIGVDAVNSQLFCMNIEELGRRCAGKITFWGEIDRQHVLVTGTPEDARNAVKRVVDNLYSPKGGVIAQFELGPGSKISQADAVFEAWEELTGSGK